MDTIYRAEPREINELSSARFDAKLEQSFTGIDSHLNRLDAKIDEFKTELRADIANLRAELIKWSFVFFATAALAVIGLT